MARYGYARTRGPFFGPMSQYRVCGASAETDRLRSDTYSAMGKCDIVSALVKVFRIDRPGCTRGGETGEGGVYDGWSGWVGEAGEDVDGEKERGKGQEGEDQLPHRRHHEYPKDDTPPSESPQSHMTFLRKLFSRDHVRAFELAFAF